MANVNDSRHLSQQLEKEYDRLTEAPISEADRELITQFAQYREGRVSRNTVKQDLGNLRRIADISDHVLVDFNRRSDIDAVMAKLERQGVSKPVTKNTYLRTIRQFFKWLGDEPDYDEYGWIENVEDYSTDRDTRRLKTKDYLSEAEVTTLREAATHPREEALIEFLADTGARINLTCNLRRKDVSLSGEHPTFEPNPNAKDGYKDVEIKRYPIHYSERHLRRWLNKRHPDEHPDAPLFPVKIGYDPADRQNMAMAPRTAGDALNDIAERTEIDRARVNAHAFRHAAVRRMKTDPNFDFDWETVKLRTAWSDRSFNEMKRLYGALENDEQLDYFAECAGRESDSDESATPMFDECPNCGEENRRDARYCDRCGREMSEDAQQLRAQAENRIVEVENKQEGEIVNAILEDIRENPDEYLSNE